MDTEKTVESGRRQLLRPVKGRWIAGVAAGVSCRFHIPVWIVRTLLVLLSLSLSYYYFFSPLDSWNYPLSWLVELVLLAMSPMGWFIPVGWGMVFYLMGWIMIPREDAVFLGSERGKPLLPYSGRFGTYLAASLIATWVGSQYFAVKYNFIPYDEINAFASAFVPILLVLAAARFGIPGTVIISIVILGFIVRLWMNLTDASNTTDYFMGVIVLNIVTTPPALLIIGLAEWQHRRRILRIHNHREPAPDSDGEGLENS